MKTKSVKRKKNGQLAHNYYRSMAEEAVSMQILDSVEKSQSVSQNKIARQTGLAAGLVHSYMKKVIAKGWVKARQVSARRWLYYLTPEGFLEKSRLTIEYLSLTMKNYRAAQSVISELLARCSEEGKRRLVVAGANGLAEIAALNIMTTEGLTLAGVVAEGSNEPVAGVQTAPFNALRSIEYDRILVCDAAFLEWWGRRDGAPDNSALVILSGPRV
ncbi:MAG: winged helix-turn-helix transcriptional regulator [Nitrospinae bacterium]|nr:winged helix-turn-helix transcriptional regulator [Nitrospinota bacterium]